MREELAVANAAVTRLSDEVNGLKAKLSDSEGKAAKLNTELATANVREGQLQEKLGESDALLNRMKDRLSSREDEYDLLESQLEQTKARLNVKIAELQSQLAAAKAIDRQPVADKTLGELNAKLGIASHQRDELLLENARLTAELEVEKRKVRDLQYEVNVLSARVHNTEAELKVAKSPGSFVRTGQLADVQVRRDCVSSTERMSTCVLSLRPLRSVL